MFRRHSDSLQNDTKHVEIHRLDIGIGIDIDINIGIGMDIDGGVFMKSYRYLKARFVPRVESSGVLSGGLFMDS